MELATPLWLAALAALSLPLFLHLISRGRARRVLFGSVRWLDANETRRARRIRPTQLLLLAVRCLFLALVALALADPRVPPSFRSSDDPEPWLLVDPTLLADRARFEAENAEAYARLDDALAASGEARLLAAGLPPVGSGPWTPLPGVDVFSALREAAEMAPPTAEFRLFTGDRQADLRGKRPALDQVVSWTAMKTAGNNRWIERARWTDDTRLRVVLGISDPERTRFESYDFEVDPQATRLNLGGELVLEPATGQLRLSAADEVPEDDTVRLSRQSPLPVRILHTVERTEDAGYVQAALSAIASVGGLPLAVEIEQIEAGRAVEESTTTGLTFWLAAAPVPEAHLASTRRGGVLISDGLERWRSCRGPAVLPATFAASGAWLTRCSPADPAEDALALWTDGAGAPLLTLEAVERGRWFRFHGRFHPEWSDLVLGAALPRWLDDLVRELSAAHAVSSTTAASDQRRSSAGERVVTPAGAARTDGRERRRSLAWLLWALAAATLALERWLSGRREIAVFAGDDR